jgi:hypothetical protein
MAYGSVLTDVVQSSTTGTPPQFNDGSGTQIGTLCRAWVNFNGVTTATINASFNVSSVTRLNTGYYQVNFTNNLTDANYALAGSAQDTLAGVSSNCPGVCISSSDLSPKSTTQVKIDVVTAGGGSYVDTLSISVAIFR